MQIKETLGQKIRELRKKQGISQERFSEIIDMTPRQIVRIENGESFPTAENLEKIAQTFNITPQELFYSDAMKSSEFLITEIIKHLPHLNNKELRMIYLVVKNL